MNESTKELLRWFFKVDLKDWTNYMAIVVAGLLFYWGIKTIIGTITASAALAP